MSTPIFCSPTVDEPAKIQTLDSMAGAGLSMKNLETTPA
jgi:hypothetical protein